MSCIEPGKLMAFLDAELLPGEAKKIKTHLEQCSHCRESFLELKKANNISQKALDTYSEMLNGFDVDSEKGWDSFKIKLTEHNTNVKDRKGAFRMKARARYLAAGIAIAVLIGVFSIVPGTRGLASGFLNVFRMERVQVVELNQNSMEQFAEDMENLMPRDLENYIDIDRRGWMEPEKVTPQEAVSRADFKLLLPDELNGAELSEVVLQPCHTVVVKPHIQELNDYLAGRGHQQLLPSELEGTEITITVPQIITARYQEGIVLTQAPEPQVAVSGNVGLEEIRSVVLANPLLPEDLRAALLSVKDWQRTMVIPDMDGTSREVKVNGEQGIFITPAREAQGVDKPHAVLIWPREGVWMTLSGHFTLQEFLRTAEALR